MLGGGAIRPLHPNLVPEKLQRRWKASRTVAKTVRLVDRSLVAIGLAASFSCPFHTGCCRLYSASHQLSAAFHCAVQPWIDDSLLWTRPGGNLACRCTRGRDNLASAEKATRTVPESYCSICLFAPLACCRSLFLGSRDPSLSLDWQIRSQGLIVCCDALLIACK